MLDERQKEIHEKGFDMFNRVDTYRSVNGPVQFNSLKLNGVRNINDALLNVGTLPKVNRAYSDKATIYRAMASGNKVLMRDISDFFYKTNGIYMRLCNYYAYMYRYDWYLVPTILDKSFKKYEKLTEDMSRILHFLDNSNIKEMCGAMALEVVKYGAYYGYIVPSKNGLLIQQLPANYCRVHHSEGNLPVVEFNMKFFDEQFRDTTYRMKVLKMFPKEFQIGYHKYRENLIKVDGDYTDSYGNPNMGWNVLGGRGINSWFPLDPTCTVRIAVENEETPLFIQAIPSLLDLEAGQELDRRKAMQELQKLIIQKLPLDKNGELIFDLDEAADLHENIKAMLANIFGADVLTTFADIDVVSLVDKNTTATQDDLKKLERTAFNNFGTSTNLFNTDGNLALEKSILSDEAMIRKILFQLTAFYDRVAQQLGNNKNKYLFRFYILETTQYNYKEMAKTFKEQVQMGYSKMLPQIALGLSQSAILNMIEYENDILNLTEIMIPPLMSSTMNSETVLGNKNKSSSSNSQNTVEGKKTAMEESKSAGRPEKAESEKSEKTLQNLESKS